LRHYASCPVHISAGPDGLSIRAQLGDYAAEYRQTTPHSAVEFVTSLGLLKAIEGAKADPVSLEMGDKGAVTAKWQDGPIPRQLVEEPPHVDAGARFPDLPPNWSDNPPELWAALAAAQGTTDPESSRYALGCIQLRGQSGVVAATDGSQLFRQTGFTFDWEGETLIRGLKLFGSRELPLDQPVHVAQQDKRIVLRSGEWTFWLPLQEGRFPRVDDVVPLPSLTKTTLYLPPAQQQFLKENLPKLKCGGFNEAVTLDLNGEVAVRSRESDVAPPTQLTLTRASYQGEQMRLVSSRRYLQRAMELGFSEVSLIGPEAVIVCRDDQRAYVWMAVDPASAIAPGEDTVEIRSPNAIERLRPRIARHTPSDPTSSHSSATETPQPPTEPNTTNRVSPRKGKLAASHSGLIEQSLALRTKLRDLLAETNELVRAAKRQKQQERLVRSTLDSLKQLQAAG
jgi:hypothetical protein